MRNSGLRCTNYAPYLHRIPTRATARNRPAQKEKTRQHGLPGFHSAGRGWRRASEKKAKGERLECLFLLDGRLRRGGRGGLDRLLDFALHAARGGFELRLGQIGDRAVRLQRAAEDF